MPNTIIVQSKTSYPGAHH